MCMYVFDIYIFKYDLDFVVVRFGPTHSLTGSLTLSRAHTLRFSLGLLLRVDDRYSTSTSSHEQCTHTLTILDLIVISG